MNKIFVGAIGAAAVLAFAPGANAATFWTVNFTPLNGSGVTGNAVLRLNDAKSLLTIRVNASGLTPNANHPGHIHGMFGPGGIPVNSTTPTIALDTDGDGFVELAEGSASYGPIILNLTELSDPGPEAPGGVLSFTQSFNLLDPLTYADNNMDGIPDFTRTDLLGADLNSLHLREIVLHGLFVQPGIGLGTPGEVNGINGYLAVLPAASGEIMLSNSAGVIPEPASWAMMIIGFGLVGGTVRSKNRTTARLGLAKA